MRRAAWAAWASLMAVEVVGAEPVAVVPVDPKPTLDGILVEWGAPEHIGLVPGGARVGVRGAFTGSADHEADLYLMWDADYVYVAAAVVDDTVDAQQIPPDKSEWRGPSGERKDAMFYYDHLKIFLRGPEQPLGHTIWLSPADGTPYLWGGMQREQPTERVPVEAGGARRDQLYTFEVGIPWRWLGLYPQPDMVLDALFLLPDSDRPAEELRNKVRQSNKVDLVAGQGATQGAATRVAPTAQAAGHRGDRGEDAGDHRAEGGPEETGRSKGSGGAGLGCR